jgi:hypothetical protein
MMLESQTSALGCVRHVQAALSTRSSAQSACPTDPSAVRRLCQRSHRSRWRLAPGPSQEKASCRRACVQHARAAPSTRSSAQSASLIDLPNPNGSSEVLWTVSRLMHALLDQDALSSPVNVLSAFLLCPPARKDFARKDLRTSLLLGRFGAQQAASFSVQALLSYLQGRHESSASQMLRDHLARFVHPSLVMRQLPCSLCHPWRIGLLGRHDAFQVAHAVLRSFPVGRPRYQHCPCFSGYLL